MTPSINGHGPPAAGGIARSSSFAPISPGVKEGVGEVATRLSEIEKLVEEINFQSTTTASGSPTMGDLQEEIHLLKKDIEDTKAVQKKKVDGLKFNVKNEAKDHITRAMRLEIEQKIKGSIEEHVRTAVREWGVLEDTKKFVDSLKSLTQQNDVLCQQAQINFNNSRSRHHNSTLDEHADFETVLSKIALPDGNVSKVFPQTLKALFSYDERVLGQLFDEYGLSKLENHLENLNRFLAFIGLRFSIPEQSLVFCDGPPEYTPPDFLESQKEKDPAEVSPLSPPNQVEQKPKGALDVQAEEKPAPDPVVANNKPARVQAQEKKTDERQTTPEQHDMERDHTGQKGTELSMFIRQQPTAAMNYRPQQTHSPRFVNQTPTAPNHQQSYATGNPQGGKGMGGWLRSIADGF